MQEYLKKVFTAISFLDKNMADKDFIKDILFPPKHDPWFPGLLSATGSANSAGLGKIRSEKNK